MRFETHGTRRIIVWARGRILLGYLRGFVVSVNKLTFVAQNIRCCAQIMMRQVPCVSSLVSHYILGSVTVAPSGLLISHLMLGTGNPVTSQSNMNTPPADGEASLGGDFISGPGYIETWLEKYTFER